LRIERRDDYYSPFDCRIPFLNSGLFDPINNYNWKDIKILLPDDLFSNKSMDKKDNTGTGILDVFELYNFTVKEDDSITREVGIDPEMLGNVFENLLDIKERKSKGAYYTPREIVKHMCQESLINYLTTEFESSIPKQEIEKLIKFQSITAKIQNNVESIDEKLKTILICDPSVGSGEFLIGIMHEIVDIRLFLSKCLSNTVVRTSYKLKLNTIKNCLYGVDIDQGAVEIAKLRLWLSLVVDEEDKNNIKPLPNLDYKIVLGNSLLSVEKKTVDESIFRNMEQLKSLYFSEYNPQKKQDYRNQIDKNIRKITNDDKSFDFEVNFSNVFYEKGGFDVIITNPPYVKEYVKREAFDNVRSSPYYQGKMDLWYMFACIGIDVLKQNGILTLIAQNNWVTSYGASKMRNKIIKETQILNFIDFGEYKIFKAGIQTMVMIFKKSTGLPKYSFDYRILSEIEPKINHVVAILSKTQINGVEYLSPIIDRSVLVDKLLTFSSPSNKKILEKIAGKSNFMLKADEVANGIHHHHERVNKKRKEILNGNHKIGEGIFVLNDEEKKRIHFTNEELAVIKPSYSTKELTRWYANPKNKEWVIYVDNNTKESIERYPNIKKHLDKYQKVITSDNKPYGLHRPRNEYFFIGEKIIVARKCAYPTFTYVNFESYVSAAFYIIKTERVDLKYLIGLLSSRLIEFWLKHMGKKQGKNYQIDKEPLLNLPLIIPDWKTLDKIVNIVDNILGITKDDDYLENIPKQTKVHIHEKQLNKLVYQLYSLTNEEIRIIESSQRFLKPHI
ncbi:TPA: N-6 DNA methylase, partial [Legionella pneumophila]|nr:N-6 DNA methylase [Legionella pneumophila]HBI2947843.1 N-6 DNA methylase [Legionella pneumophila]